MTHEWLDQLVTMGVVTREARRRAAVHAQQSASRLEDALIETGAISENDLLKHLAGTLRTRFVSTQKLARATVERSTLDLVTVRLAERLIVFPVLSDTGSVSLVAADPVDTDVVRQLERALRPRSVKLYLARPAAIRAAIRKHYHGEGQAFATLEGAFTAAPVTATAPTIGIDLEGAPTANRPVAPTPELPLGFGFSGVPAAAPVRPPTPRPPPPAPTFTIDAPDLVARLKSGVNASPPAAPPPVERETTAVISVDERVVASAAPASVPVDTFLETVNVLVAMHEQIRGELRGHSSAVARLARRVAERMGLEGAALLDLSIAAYLHDIGKASSYHLTALNVAQYEGHKAQAQKMYLTPLRLFESARLPEGVTLAISHLYERFDGQGFPGRLRRKDIPVAARILAVVEAYADVTTHAKNPYRRVLPPNEACDALATHAGTIFDGSVIDVLRLVALGDDLRSSAGGERKRLLVVDPDAEETIILELRLVETGHAVTLARSSTEALKLVASGEVDLVLTEVEIQPDDGFALVEKLRAAHADLPFLFVARKGDRESLQRGLDLGALDYLVKPVSPELVAAKVARYFSSDARPVARGVSGSLREMALPDVVQVLSNGRKSGKLTLRAGGKSGDVWFTDGFVYDAAFGTHRGEEAFYALLVLEEGEFSLDPEARSVPRVINAPTESLLLEGMRRMDEAKR